MTSGQTRGKENVPLLHFTAHTHTQKLRSIVPNITTKLSFYIWSIYIYIYIYIYTHTHIYVYIYIHIEGEDNGNPLQCSFLENPRDRGAWWAAIFGVTQSRTRLKQLSSIHIERDRKTEEPGGIQSIGSQ